MVIITGVSRGIGFALANYYLHQGKKVVGIGRNHAIQHENFSFIPCDLGDVEAVNALSFDVIDSVQELTFIHNAGMLGEVDYHKNCSSKNLQEVMQVNVCSGAALLQKIEKQFSKQKHFNCIFISSGAGKNPISGWAAYCASKAAVDMFCRTLADEWMEWTNGLWTINALAPGVVDTDMQVRIRSTPESKFKDVQKFIDYKENGDLYSLNEFIIRFARFEKDSDKNTVATLRDYSI
jgi:benzil reductase ((S)-benzoin forming)